MAAGAQQQRHAAGECCLSLGLKGFLSILVSASRLNVSTRTQGQNSGIDSALSANFVGCTYLFICRKKHETFHGCVADSFYPLDVMLARLLAMALCPSVCLSQVGVLSKRLNESSWFLACELPSTRPSLC